MAAIIAQGPICGVAKWHRGLLVAAGSGYAAKPRCAVSETEMDRRRFLQSLAAAALSPAASAESRATDERFGPLQADAGGILDLPAGFHYKIVSRAGTPMSDGLVVPEAHDGMAAFAGPDGRVILVCNHELETFQFGHGAFGETYEALPDPVKAALYDRGGDSTPGLGGTTTTIWNARTGTTERQFLSLAGTEVNCSGGRTPWGSWLSCEECFSWQGIGFGGGRILHRDRPHGYVFEVPASHEGLVDPQPITSMGRFEHEAAAVHDATGIVYLTEDKHDSLFYRFIPSAPGKLQWGGRLQALAIDGAPAMPTHNWWSGNKIVRGMAMATRWIDLADVDTESNDLRLRGAASGAATFARGEGLCAAGDDLVFTCTIGGRFRLGQVFAYTPSRFEGTAGERDEPGRLTLIAESSPSSILRNADNLTMAPWGELIVCEDTASHCGLVGLRADGTQYQLADNPYSNSELSGACFSPDGNTLFVNIQYPGTTLAITGPFPS
jgi:uncharacterized protein